MQVVSLKYTAWSREAGLGKICRQPEVIQHFLGTNSAGRMREEGRRGSARGGSGATTPGARVLGCHPPRRSSASYGGSISSHNPAQLRSGSSGRRADKSRVSFQPVAACAHFPSLRYLHYRIPAECSDAALALPWVARWPGRCR